jgi:hypothetical protein
MGAFSLALMSHPADTGYLPEEVSQLACSCPDIPSHRIEADMSLLTVLTPPGDQKQGRLPIGHQVRRMGLATVLANGPHAQVTCS